MSFLNADIYTTELKCFGGNIDNTPIGQTTAANGRFILIKSTSTANSATFSDTTASIYTPGGVSITKNANVGQNFRVTGSSTFTGSAVFLSRIQSLNTMRCTSLNPPTAAISTLGGASIKKNLCVGEGLEVNGTSVFNGFVQFNGGASINGTASTFSGIVTFTGTAQSFNPTTGAVIVYGGVGIGKNLNVGQNFRVTGSSTFNGSSKFNSRLSVTNTLSCTSLTPPTASLTTLGGAAIKKNLCVGEGLEVNGTSAFMSPVTINATTQSNGTGSGALVVKGGVGIKKNLYVGGNLYVSGATATNPVMLTEKFVVTGTTTVNPNNGSLYAATIVRILGANSNVSGTLANGPLQGALKEIITKFDGTTTTSRYDLTITNFQNPAGTAENILRFTRSGQSAQLFWDGTTWDLTNGGASVL